jgi:hypothetical protein
MNQADGLAGPECNCDENKQRTLDRRNWIFARTGFRPHRRRHQSENDNYCQQDKDAALAPGPLRKKSTQGRARRKSAKNHQRIYAHQPGQHGLTTSAGQADIDRNVSQRPGKSGNKHGHRHDPYRITVTEYDKGSQHSHPGPHLNLEPGESRETMQSLTRQRSRHTPYPRRREHQTQHQGCNMVCMRLGKKYYDQGLRYQCRAGGQRNHHTREAVRPHMLYSIPNIMYELAAASTNTTRHHGEQLRTGKTGGIAVPAIERSRPEASTRLY